MFLHKPLTVVHRGFNPCCSGLVGETQNAREDRSGLGVSILVVVDWSVRPYLAVLLWLGFQFVFQSLL